MGKEGTYLKIIKAIYNKPTENIIFNGEKLKVFPLRSGIRLGCPLLSLIIQHSLRSPSHGNQRRKRKKIVKIGKESKLLLFANEMILYTENPKDATRKLLELINKVSRVAKLIHRNLLHSYIQTMKDQKGK